MKISGLFLILIGISPSLMAGTAYQALEYLVDHRGNAILEDVMLVRGEGGHPQPTEWIVYRGKPNASYFDAAGVTAKGRILTAKSSAHEVNLPPHAEPVRFSMLSVDSNKALQIASREARKENFSFGRIDYELKTNSIAGVPAWSMHLFNEAKSYVGKLTISAATGEILYPLQFHSYVVEDIDGQEKMVTVREPWLRRAVRSVGRWFSQTGTTYGKDTLRALGTAEEILVGDRSRDDAFHTD